VRVRVRERVRVVIRGRGEEEEEGRRKISYASAHARTRPPTHAQTALHWAAKRGHEEFVKLLLQHKADPAALDDG